MPDHSETPIETPIQAAETEAGLEYYMKDIWDVGKDKPVGFLPLSTVTDICGLDVDKVRDDSLEKGLETFVVSEEESHTASGALYAYDKEAVISLLKDHFSLLEKNGWPTTPDEFVMTVASKFAEDSALYELVGRAFADTRFTK